MKLQQSLAMLVALCLFSTSVFAEDAEAKKETDAASTAKSGSPTDAKTDDKAKSETPVPPAPPKQDAEEAKKKDENTSKNDDAKSELATDVDSLRLLVKVLRAELDELKASRVAEQKALKKAKEEIDTRFAQLDVLKDEVKTLNETLTEVAKSAKTSETQLKSVIADSASVLATLDKSLKRIVVRKCWATCG